jgi:two-component system, chemotaxis family, chemotaxis protein CheY
MDSPKVKPKKCTILLVDDEEEFRVQLERKLFAVGYDVHVTANGKLAFQKLQTGIRFDLILCDLRMPVMDGAAFISEVRKVGSKIPIIVLTGTADREAIKLLAPLKLSGLLLKPFKPNELLDKIKAVLNQPAATPAATSPPKKAA